MDLVIRINLYLVLILIYSGLRFFNVEYHCVLITQKIFKRVSVDLRIIVERRIDATHDNSALPADKTYNIFRESRTHCKEPAENYVLSEG